MNRLFTWRQRQALRLLAGNMCSICGDPLEDDFHGDHKVSYANDGRTTLMNGQALCPPCNLKKGSRNEQD